MSGWLLIAASILVMGVLIARALRSQESSAAPTGVLGSARTRAWLGAAAVGLAGIVWFLVARITT